MKIEGYWNHNNPKYLESYKRNQYPNPLSEYPLPIGDVLSEQEAQEISDLIKKVEARSRCHTMKGCSYSRITGESLGNAEFENKDWRFPADFRTHYVLEYKVKPTDEFLKYIGYKK